MKTKIMLGGALVTALLAAASTAGAQQATFGAQAPSEQKNWFMQDVRAPKHALELTLGTGYTQGFGMLESGVGVPDALRSGIGVQLGAAYRFNPQWSLGASGQYQEIYAQRANAARGLTAGLDGTFHVMPYTRTDPWISLGAGYRSLWEVYSSQSDRLTHGFQLARASVGVDIKASDDVAIAPVIGGDLDTFIWHNSNGSTTAISEPRVSTFVFAGIQGRVDVLGRREPTVLQTAKR